MAKEYLKPIYKKVFDKGFDPYSFESRMEMQKMIFLLQEASIKVGDYDFFWYKHGPYSQGLQDDILSLNGVPDTDICYSVEAERIIGILKKLFSENGEYNLSQWVECLASLKYLRDYIFSMGASDDDILEDLAIRKKHLSNKELNRCALQRIKEIFG